jgi:hypothetical protein
VAVVAPTPSYLSLLKERFDPNQRLLRIARDELVYDGDNSVVKSKNDAQNVGNPQRPRSHVAKARPLIEAISVRRG